MADGDGPFLWLSEWAPPAGFRRVPTDGMCVSAFVFLKRGDRVLVGRYAEHPEWERLTGLDPDRVREHGRGWTVPATHLRLGEDPRAAGRRVVEDVLGLPAMALSEPRVEVEMNTPKRFPDLHGHYDMWFLMEAETPNPAALDVPPWYAALEWRAPEEVPAEEWARGHEDVVARWRGGRRPPPSP